MSQNYKLLISYDGTSYGGWQIQPNALSIQAILENAVQIILRQEITIIASGRTDAGVHALGQVAHFRYSAPIDPSRFLYSLNALIPRDIRVQAIIPVSDKFHAQHSAIRKTYRYNLCLDEVQDPFRRLYSWHVRRRLDFAAIEEACRYLEGTHDFTSFANEAYKGSAAKDPVRTISSIVFHRDGSESYLEFTADGFLYKMVRSMVGTLIEVGAGKIEPSAIPYILAAKDRTKAGQVAPAHGLFLMEVIYNS
jgi:tRNA pseudouridine38-40 synthase